MSACLAGDVSNNILNRNYEKQKSLHYYIEIYLEKIILFRNTRSSFTRTKEVNAGLVKLSKELGIPLVATNDLHYVNKEDAKIHDVLMYTNG